MNIKKLMKLMTALIIFMLAISLTGCGTGYSSHYMGTMLVRSENTDSASFNFGTFEGSMVFKLKCGKAASGQIEYSAALEEGDVTVYYDNNGAKKELCSLSSGDALEASTGQIDPGTVYIIIETSGKCKGGGFQFKIK